MEDVIIDKDGNYECNFVNLFLEEYNKFEKQERDKEEAFRKERELEQERRRKIIESINEMNSKKRTNPLHIVTQKNLHLVVII